MVVLITCAASSIGVRPLQLSSPPRRVLITCAASSIGVPLAKAHFLEFLQKESRKSYHENDRFDKELALDKHLRPLQMTKKNLPRQERKMPEKLSWSKNRHPVSLNIWNHSHRKKICLHTTEHLHKAHDKRLFLIIKIGEHEAQNWHLCQKSFRKPRPHLPKKGVTMTQEALGEQGGLVFVIENH